jgi:hypothetical protein
MFSASFKHKTLTIEFILIIAVAEEFVSGSSKSLLKLTYAVLLSTIIPKTLVLAEMQVELSFIVSSTIAAKFVGSAFLVDITKPDISAFAAKNFKLDFLEFEATVFEVHPTRNRIKKERQVVY